MATEELLHLPGEEYISDGYPSEYVSPKTKETREFGAQYAKAMYGSARYDGLMSLDYEEMEFLIDLAQGRQSIDDIKKRFGFFDEDDGTGSLAHVDVQVLNLAPKYINRAVAKMMRFGYDVAVDAVDVVSIEEKKHLAATIEAFYRMKDFVESIGLDPRQLFQELDVDALPKYPDELLYDLTVNPKIKKEIAAEIAIKLLHYVNDYKQKMREFAWWIVVIGRGHLHFYHDENGVPRCEVIHPRDFIGSWADNESYHDQQHAGFIQWISVDRLRREMLNDGYSEEQIMSISEVWKGGNLGTLEYSGTNPLDGKNYVPVMRFYFKSEDNRRFVKMKNQYDSDILLEKSFDYEPSDDVRPYFERGERKLIKNTYTSIYGGTWVVGSNVVYNYGRQKMPRTNLVEAQLPIVSFAPNMKDGRVVSFLSQMKEPLNMVNVVWNKTKEIVAKGWMGVREIDFTQLENVAIGKGGQQWTPQDVYKHFLRTNTLIKRSAINKHDQQYSGSAIEDTNAGLTLSDYLTTFTTAINMLEQMTSTPIVDSMTMPDRVSATAVKESTMTSDIDMEYLYNAYEYVYLRGTHMLLLLLQESLRDRHVIKGYIPALGKVNTGYYEVPEDVAYTEYGMQLHRQPGPEEWASFYSDVAIALQNQEIGIADSAFIREIDNLKQARQMLAIRAKQHKRELREDAEFNNRLAMEANQAAAQSKAQFEAMKEDSKGENAQELAILQGRIQENLLRMEKSMDAEIAGVTNMVKERINRQTGLDSIVREAIRARSDRFKSVSQLRGTIISATQKAESDRVKAQMQKDKPKPKSGSKK